MKRVVIAELLDTDNGSPAEVAAALLDIHHINRRFGGISTSVSLIETIAKELGKTSLSWLEVAAGSGETIKAVRQELSSKGIRLDLTLLDRARTHVGNGNNHDVQVVVGDALALPFPDASFDLVGCNLFAHHLSPDQIVQFGREGLRVSREAFIINDVVRHLLHLAFVYAGMPSFRSRLTRHDAPASVRQAYTIEEMRALLVRAGASRVEIRRHYLFRMGVIAWK
jgi:SAM-dependent methyltransferase